MSKIKNKKLSNLINAAKKADVPVSEIKSSLLEELSESKLKELIDDKGIDKLSLKELVKKAHEKGVPVKKIKELVKDSRFDG